nr:immunoglobulin light chain junction region [Macaca mulatta]MOX09501.1 immunoglobulin light chain junction region [Macaca mulatta]
CQQHDIPPYTF